MTPQTPVKPAQSPKTILEGAALDVLKTAPEMHFGSGVICNFPPLMDEQESLYCGIWSDDSAPTPTILGWASVHQIINSEVASRWMKNEATRLPPGSVVVPYDLGVPAYLSTVQSLPRVRMTFRVGITFGKGRFIVLVSGTSKVDVDRVARAVLRQISN